MKSKTKNEAENSRRAEKDKAEKPLQKRMKDPTLEGQDKDKVRVGRIQEEFVPVD